MTTRPLRALGYVRLSDYRTNDASTSPERQREAIEGYCTAKGWNLVHVEEDLDVSGSDVGLRLDRPGLVALRKHYPRADVLVIPKIDRLARNVADFMRIAEEAKEHDVVLVSVAESLDLSTPSGRFVAQILAAFAEMEAGTIRARVIDGNRKARELGRFLGGVPPYGYRAVNNPNGPGRVLEIAPEEAAVVREVAEAILGGSTVYRVTRELNERGIPSKTGKTWSIQAVRQVLTSPRVVGRRTHAGKVLTGADGLPLQFEEPILHLDTWHRLRAVLAPTPTDVRRPPNPSRLLSGLVSCALCGGRMNPGPTGGDGKHSYRCSTASRSAGCIGVSVRCEPLEAYLVDDFLRRFGPLPVRRVIEIAPEEPAALVEVRAAIEAAALAMTEDSADVVALAERLRRLKEERRRLEEAPTESRFEVVEEGTFAEAWEADEDTERRRDLLAEAIASIRVSPGKAGRRPFNPDRLEIVWAQGPLLADYGDGESEGPRRLSA